MSIVKKAVYEKGFGKAIVSNDVKDHANDPFFAEKLEKAKKTLSKVVFPENIKK
jgi:hypothetical protein